ncbi:hypothetical protein Barb6_01187 [Bacteroidales bacterium Barb6]|nr:hypothetical protein Barb6_01187 [Bacteroidales bacterium Barb6]
MDLIRQNPQITGDEIAQQLAITTRWAKKILAKLVEDKLIERHGSRKDGEWRIT